jgi:hypothetical protein
MINTIATLLRAKEMLDKRPLPGLARSAWMTKKTFLALGGTHENWDQIEGDDETKLVQA